VRLCTHFNKMGCDGGSIPRRDELVKLKKKAEKVDPTEIERIKWFTCALSHERLKDPIVACELGHLYNKEAVIRALLEKSIDEKFSHIRSLKDLIIPRFTPNPTYNASSAETDTSGSSSPFLCPITMVAVSNVPFNIIRTCGCVLSERAMREVPSPTCLQCGTSFTSEDVLQLNPSKEVKEVLRARMEAKRAGEKNKKKDKKEKREKRREKKEGKAENGVNGEKVENGVNGHKENGEKKESEKIGEKANGTKDKGLGLDLEKKGKKREIETSASTSEPSTKTTKLNPSSSSSKPRTTTISSTTTSTTTTTTTTYTPYVAPHGGDKDEANQPTHFTVPKTAAYNSLLHQRA